MADHPIFEFVLHTRRRVLLRQEFTHPMPACPVLRPSCPQGAQLNVAPELEERPVPRDIIRMVASAAKWRSRCNATAQGDPPGFASGVRDGAVRGALRAPFPVITPLLLEAIAGFARLHQMSCRQRQGSYFDTDFLNMRSIFSLICSIACEFC
jgi:hypothetical protein